VLVHVFQAGGKPDLVEVGIVRGVDASEKEGVEGGDEGGLKGEKSREVGACCSGEEFLRDETC
jgi:hypothetical protein